MSIRPKRNPPSQPAPRTPAFQFASVLATGLGAGWAPLASGTVGTLVGLPPAYWTFAWPWAARLAVLAVLILVGGWASEICGRRWGHDDGRIVIDEIAGVYLTLLAVPAASPLWFGVGFVCFRVMDILKPPPAALFDRWKGGWWTMADDLVAGFYGAAIVRIAVYFAG